MVVKEVVSMKKIKFCQKRDGSVESFEKKRITKAIYKAFKESREGNKTIADKVTETVHERLIKIYGTKPPEVEVIQDIVEDTLMNYNFRRTAKAYILYREEHSRKRKTTL